MTIAVIGAGASGMMAALTAAETPENKILLFERQARVGRKLAVTGNGRCNLTNTGAAPENYHGAQPEFAARALAAFPPAAALDWFAAHGLLTVTEPGGRVYPLSNAANSVVDVLRFAL
ncbi:MAG: FAD-binding protein, partial [Clostridiales bacterium]|nr:FAD-binding protein [Clostridiales bacterium]